MRVISGKHKGRVLEKFKGDAIRPTADRAKEALFNIISYDIKGANFLDLFSGTGSIGIEAISRGADKVIFVDGSRESASIIKTNLSKLKEQALVEVTSAETYLLKTNEKFDFIFLDPPYNYKEADNLFKIIKEKNLLNAGGVIIYEHANDYDFTSQHFEIYDTRKYGIATFDFYVEGEL